MENDMNKLKSKIKELQKKNTEEAYAELRGIRFVLNDLEKREVNQHFFNRGIDVGKKSMIRSLGKSKSIRRSIDNYRYRVVKRWIHKIDNKFIPDARNKDEILTWNIVKKWMRDIIKNDRYLDNNKVICLKNR